MLRNKIGSFVAVVGLLCGAAHAQITGGLRGTVSDPSGAAVPSATVTLTSLETRQVRTQSVNEHGTPWSQARTDDADGSTRGR